MAEITAPTLIIHREADAIVPLEGREPVPTRRFWEASCT